MHNNRLSARASRRLTRFLRPLALVGLSGALLFSVSCTKLESRDQMNKGVNAYKHQAYADAVKHFQRAVKLDSNSKNARLYLATAYMVQWVPGADTPDNNKNFELAQRTFKEVLDGDPSNSLALQSLAFMAYSKASAGTPEEKQAALETARQWNNKRIEANPKDSEPYYYLGVIDYDEVDPPLQTARVDENLAPTDPGPIKNPKVRKALGDKYLDTINSGMDNLKKCLALDPENDDAMDYVSLLLRRRALLQSTTEEAKADASQADDWFNKATAMKRQKAEEAKAKAAKKG